MYPSCTSILRISALEQKDTARVRDYILSLEYPSAQFLISPHLASKTTVSDLKRVEETIREGLYCRLKGYLPYALRQVGRLGKDATITDFILTGNDRMGLHLLW
jgi:GTPase Era involved in 16S rRNA processing